MLPAIAFGFRWNRTSRLWRGSLIPPKKELEAGGILVGTISRSNWKSLSSSRKRI